MIRPTAALLLLVATLAMPAAACLNDRQILADERQFKSSYLGEPTRSSVVARVPIIGWVAIGLGVTLMAASVVVVRRRPPAQPLPRPAPMPYYPRTPARIEQDDPARVN